MPEFERVVIPRIDLASIDCDVTRLFDPEFHSDTPLDDGHGTVYVDGVIAGLLEDLNRLSFVVSTTSSCAGGSSDGAGGQRALSEVSPGKFSWAGYVGFDIERNWQLIDRAVAFLGDVQRLQLQGEVPDDEVHACFELRPQGPKERLREELASAPAATLELIFDRSMVNPELSAMSRAAWGELHRLVREVLVSEQG